MCSSETCDFDKPSRDESPAVMRFHGGQAFMSNVTFGDQDANPYSDARIMDQIGYAREQLSKLHVLVRILENRIEILLLPEQEVTTVAYSGEVAMATSTSELSTILNDLNVQIRLIAAKVDNVTGRVQL